jgi:hypothetical protein
MKETGQHVRSRDVYAVQRLCGKANRREVSLMEGFAQAAAVAHTREWHVLSVDVYAVGVVWSKEKGWSK